MEILVIGAGVIGVTTAYMLAKAGYQVTVIEANSTVASEASHANGGQLSYDFAAPMGSPAILRKLPAILAGKDIGFRMAPGFDRHYLGWSAQFLKNCAPARTKENAAKLSSLVTASGKALQTIIAETEIEFKYRKAGKLVVYETETALAATRKAAEGDTNDQLKILSADECRALEPALDHRHAPMAGGVWAADDDVGDAALFTQNLATYCRKKLNARFILGEIVENFLIENNTVRGVLTNSGQTIDADKITCCLGAHGDTLLRPLGIRLPIYPIKGYSITAPIGESCPEIAITEASHRLVYSRLGNSIRIAGFADFTPKHHAGNKDRLQMLWHTARELMPQIADFQHVQSDWIGYRPATPNSLPIIGATKIKNLYLNMGHGMFGWTLAAGSSHALLQALTP